MASKKSKALERFEPWPDNWKSYTFSEKEKYINIWKERCYTGYAGLTGRHFFYATTGHLKTPKGKIIRPMVRDMDMHVAEEFEVAKANQEDYAIAKRRGYALTSYFGGGMTMFNAMTMPNTISMVTSADQGRLEDMYTNKIRVYHQYMPEGLKEPLVSKRMGKMLHFGVANGDDIDGLNSMIMCVETSDGPSSPSKMEAGRICYVFIDESALHPYAGQVVAVSQASISDEGEKLNPVVIGGSSGVANPKGLKYMREIWFDPNSGFRKLFIEGYWCMNNVNDVDDNGKPIPGKIISFMYQKKDGYWYSDVKAARAWIEKKRLTLFKAKNKLLYYQFCKAYPLYQSEYFDIVAEGAFTEDIQNHIINAGVRVLNNPPTWAKYHLIDRNGKVEGIVDEANGFIEVLTPPAEHTTYGAGVDPIPFGDNKMETVLGSDVAMMLAPFNDPLPHALMKIKSQDADLVASQMILAQRWYNDALAMVERNRGGVLMSKYYGSGNSHLLAKQPTWFGHKYFDKAFRDGYYYGTGTMDKVEDELISWIKTHLIHAQSLALLDDLKVYKAANTDVADAWKAFLVQRRQYMFMAKINADGGEDVFEQALVVTYGPNGERYERYATITATPEKRLEKLKAKARGDYFDTRGYEQDDYGFYEQ